MSSSSIFRSSFGRFHIQSSVKLKEFHCFRVNCSVTVRSMAVQDFYVLLHLACYSSRSLMYLHLPLVPKLFLIDALTFFVLKRGKGEVVRGWGVKSRCTNHEAYKFAVKTHD